MGVIYKLRPKIKDFILQEKEKQPNLSCRKLASLAGEKFQIKLSKSTVNSLIKQANLSMPVGRRRKKRRATQEAIGSGTSLLLAADYLVGGASSITEAIKNRLNLSNPELLAKTEALLFEFLANPQARSDYGLWALIKRKFTPEIISSYLVELRAVSALSADIFRAISGIFQEVHCLKVDLADHNSLYLDAQLRTVWSTPYTPYDFSATINNTKSYINKYFREDKPFILFMVPGYEVPTKEFFDFILSFEAREKSISKLTLYGNKLQEIEVIPITGTQKRYFIFGLWPWQFTAYRKIEKMGEYKLFYFEPLKADFYLAEIELELSQPNVNHKVTLRGCALKTDPSTKIRLVILSNLFSPAVSIEELANLYLGHWPNLEESFQDFSRKIELFTYTAASAHFFSTESLNLTSDSSSSIEALLNDYLKALDAYARWRFLPQGYEEKDFAATKERFYSLPTRLKKQKDSILITFQPPADYPFLKDLQYALRRANEREISFGEGKRLWFGL